MTISTEIPPEFGGSWPAFCREWCPEGALAYSQPEVCLGLSTLMRLWPQEVARVVGESARGALPAASTIDTGLLLAACEPARYFSRVLDRLKSHQRSAYSELVLVAALRRLSYDPQFESPTGGTPDAQCVVDGVPIAFEVYAPDPSHASKEQQRLVGELQEAIRRGIASCRVEIGILDVFGKSDMPTAVDVIRSAAPSTWTDVGNWARVRRVDQGQTLPSMFNGDGAQIIIGGNATTQGPSTDLIVRWEQSDARIEHALQKKRAQVSAANRNVVVMNVCAVGGIGEWPEIVARLPGADYEKIGVIAFFDQGSLGPPEAIRRRWRVVVNSRALQPIPEALIDRLKSLDESSHWGLPRKPRLVMC